MINNFKFIERLVFLLLLLVALSTFLLSIFCFILKFSHAQKLLDTSAQVLVLSGLIQLEVSGFFDVILKHYGNEKKYPYGPPSFITREIIDDPDRIIYTWLRNLLLFNSRTGFWLIVLGSLIQIVVIWLAN